MCKDIRVYCGKCAQDVRDAGYLLMRTAKQTKEECDKCNRMGFEYDMKDKKVLLARLIELDKEIEETKQKAWREMVENDRSKLGKRV